MSADPDDTEVTYEEVVIEDWLGDIADSVDRDCDE